MAATGNPYIVKANMQFSLSAASIKPVIDSLQTGLAGKKISIPVSLKVDKNITNQVTNQTGAFKSLAAAIRSVGVASGLTASKMGALNASLHGLKANLTGINPAMKSFNTSTAQFNKATTAAQKFNQTISSTKKNVETFGYTAGVSARRFSAFIVSATAITGLAYQMIEATKEALNFDRELVRLKQVSGDTNGEIKGIADEVTRLSKTLGTSSSDLIKTATTLKQAGYSARDTKLALDVLAKTTLLPTFDSLQNTTEGLIATFSQFGEGAGALERQFGSINKVAADFAVESSDLVEAVKRAGAAFHGAGGNLNELLAIFTSIRATTRESAESIATGLRTIIARLQDPKINESLKEIGVNLYDLKGNFIGPYEAARKLHDALADIDPRNITFANVLKEIGGLRQLSRALPFITQFSKAEEALGSAMQGQGSLTKDAATAQEAFLVQITKVKEQFLELFRIITNDSTVRSFMNLLVTSLTAVNSALKDMRGLIPVLALFGAAKFISAAPNTKGEFFRGFSSPRGYATGGQVRDPRDTVPAWLQPGEFVVPKTAAQRIGYGALRGLVSKTKTAGYGAALGAMSGMATGNINTAMFGAASGFFSSFRRAKGYAKGDIIPFSDGNPGTYDLVPEDFGNYDIARKKAKEKLGNKSKLRSSSTYSLGLEHHNLTPNIYQSPVHSSVYRTTANVGNPETYPVGANPNGYSLAPPNYNEYGIGSTRDTSAYGVNARTTTKSYGTDYHRRFRSWKNAPNSTATPYDLEEQLLLSERNYPGGKSDYRGPGIRKMGYRLGGVGVGKTGGIPFNRSRIEPFTDTYREIGGSFRPSFKDNTYGIRRGYSINESNSNHFGNGLSEIPTVRNNPDSSFSKIKNYTKKLTDGFKETEKGIQQISSSAQHASDSATQGLKKSRFGSIAGKIAIAAAIIPVAHHYLTGDRSGSPIGKDRLPASPLVSAFSGGFAGGSAGLFLAHTNPYLAIGTTAIGGGIGAYEGYKAANKENEEFVQQRRLRNFDDVRSNLQFTNHDTLIQQSANELSAQLPIPGMKELEGRQRERNSNIVSNFADLVAPVFGESNGSKGRIQQRKAFYQENVKDRLRNNLSDEEKSTISDTYLDLYKKRRAYNPTVSREAALSELPSREVGGKTLTGRDLLGLKGGMEARLNAYDKSLADAIKIQSKLNSIEIQATSSFLFTIDELNQFSERLHNAGEQFQQNLGYGKQIAGAVTGNITASPTKLNLGDIGSPTGSKIYNFAKPGGDYDQAKKEVSWILNTVRENFVGEGADASENARRFADNAFTGGGQYHNELRDHLLNALKDPEQLKLLKNNKGHGKQILNKVFEGVDPIKESNDQNEKVLNQVYQQYQGERIGLDSQLRGIDEKRAGFDMESASAINSNRAKYNVAISNPFTPNLEEKDIEFQRQSGLLNRITSNNNILGPGLAGFDSTNVEASGKVINAGQIQLAQLQKQQVGATGNKKIEIGDQITKLSDKLARLGKTMEDTANDTSNLDAAQKKFDLRTRQLEGDTAVRKNFAKTLTFGSREESMGLMQRENLVNQVAGFSPEQFRALPDNVRQMVGEHLDQTQDLVRERPDFDKIGRLRMEKKEFGPMVKTSVKDIKRDIAAGREPAMFKRKYAQMVPKPLRFTGKELQERLMGPALKGVGFGDAGNLAAMQKLNQARMEFETASEKRRNDQLVLMNNQSKNITDQSVRLTAQFKDFMSNINQSIENQMDAANIFMDSAAKLTKALSTFDGTVKIERNGKLEIVINGFEQLKKIGDRDVKLEFLQKAVEQFSRELNDLKKAKV